MQFVDRCLAKRLEMIMARSGKECADVWADIAGGIATYSGIDSPITQAFGFGMFEPVSHAELDQIEECFFSRSAQVALELCPFIHPSLVALLKSSPYRLEDFSNVLARELRPGEEIAAPDSDLFVRAAGPQEITRHSESSRKAFQHRFRSARHIGGS
jgi:hypothetical protein